MAKETGRIGALSAGSNIFNSNLTAPLKFVTFICGGKTSGDTVNHGSIGTADGTNQNVQYWSPSVSNTTSSDVILIKDAAGTVQLQAQFSSFGSAGGLGTVTINVSTNNTSFRPTMVIEN